MPFDFGDESINTGDTVGVQCLINKGDLPMEIRWVLDSSPIISGQNGISIVKLSQRTSTLNINSVEGMHRGIFKCVVSNAAGSVEHSAELNVNGWLNKVCVMDCYGVFCIRSVRFFVCCLLLSRSKPAFSPHPADPIPCNS